jgi:hypothetical protein
MALLGATKKTGWEQGRANAHHKITSYLKHFPEGGVTAVMTFRPGLDGYVYGYGGVDDQEMESCSFVPLGLEAERDAVPLGEVDALVLNEVAGLMYALTKKG